MPAGDWFRDVLQAGPSAAYRFEGDSGAQLRDEGPGGLHGTYLGTAAGARPGVRSPNGAFGGSFPGPYSYCANSDLSALGTMSNFSAEVGVRFNVLSGAAMSGLFQIGAGPDGAAGVRLGEIGFRPGQLQYWAGASSSTAGVLDRAFDLVPGAFYHIALTSDGSTARLYRNGVLISTTSAASFVAGQRYAPFNYQVSRISNCTMYGLAIYNRTLPPSEIAFRSRRLENAA